MTKRKKESIINNYINNIRTVNFSLKPQQLQKKKKNEKSKEEKLKHL